jgi:hypothetical protein
VRLGLRPGRLQQCEIDRNQTSFLGPQQNPVRGRGSGNPEIRERIENGPEKPYALAILPLLMQLVQTRIRFGAPFTSALTACKLTFQRRRVTLWACEMLLPNCGPFPQTSHTCAIALLPILDCFVLPQFHSAQISIAKCRSFDISRQRRKAIAENPDSSRNGDFRSGRSID